MQTVGDLIRKARKARGWSQEKLAAEVGKLANEGVAKPAEEESWGQNRISNYEKGRDPSISDLRLIAQVLNVPVASFFDDAINWPFRTDLREKLARLGPDATSVVERQLESAIGTALELVAAQKGGRRLRVERSHGHAGAVIYYLPRPPRC